jgi:hypothetical protein
MLCSQRVPVCAHAGRAVTRQRVERVLEALEAAYDWLAEEGWPLPYPDGGAGGSSDFDLYLVPGLDHAADARLEAPIAWSSFDAATSYGLLDGGLADSALGRCALTALATAALLGHDPVETQGVPRAGGGFATWLATGVFGCDDTVGDAQRAPELGPVGDGDEQSAVLSLWLAMISRRHDGGSGRFVRELFALAQKHSERPSALHTSPSFFQAFSAVLEKAGESLDQSAAELAVARYFAEPASSDGLLPAMERAAKVPTALAPQLSSLPKHLPGCQPPLALYGSAYTRVPTRGAPQGARVLVWLRGEPAARWSLIALRLDEKGHELGRVEAPARRVPESFFPVELTSDTSEVLLVVTALPFQHLDERSNEDEPYCFQLIVDSDG